MKNKKESYESPEMHLFLMPSDDIIVTSSFEVPDPLTDDKAYQDINDANKLKGRKH